jgi:hypothetical protein
MFPSRKKFRFHITPSDRQLWAIGIVAVTWTLLDNLLQVSASALAGDDKAIKEQYDSVRSFKIRIDILKDLIETRMREPFRQQFLDLVTEIKNAQVLRDRIIHGSWGDNGRLLIDDPEARGAFNWLQPHPPFDWKLDYGKIKEVAERVDDLAFRWSHAAISGEIGSDIKLSDALRNKLHKPSHG